MQFIHRWNSNLTQSRWCNKRLNQLDPDLLQLFFHFNTNTPGTYFDSSRLINQQFNQALVSYFATSMERHKSSYCNRSHLKNDYLYLALFKYSVKSNSKKQISYHAGSRLTNQQFNQALVSYFATSVQRHKVRTAIEVTQKMIIFVWLYSDILSHRW